MRDPGRHANNERRRKWLKAVRLMGARRFRTAMRHGVAAAIEHGTVPIPPDVRTVIDVGSHSGQFVVFALERFPRASIICFEPLEGPRVRLTAALEERDRERVSVHPYALSNGLGSAPIHVSRADDSSSLLPIGERYTQAFPGTEEVRGERVPTERLDAVLSAIERPSLLKVDVQGCELEVLEGAERLLAEIDFIIVEVSFVELYVGQALAGEVVAFLHHREFSLSGAYGVKRDHDGHCLQADFFFTRRRATAG